MYFNSSDHHIDIYIHMHINLNELRIEILSTLRY